MEYLGWYAQLLIDCPIGYLICIYLRINLGGLVGDLPGQHAANLGSNLVVTYTHGN